MLALNIAGAVLTPNMSLFGIAYPLGVTTANIFLENWSVKTICLYAPYRSTQLRYSPATLLSSSVQVVKTSGISNKWELTVDL